MIDVSNVFKRYGEFEALAGATFRVPTGAVAALVGPNGAGKTTILRTLCGILRPTSGSLAVDGIDVSADPVTVKRKTAYVPDDPPLFESLTVWEHLQFVASAYRLDGWRDVAESLLSQFELQAKRDALAAELSRGMRQKVALTCAYLRRPSTLLLDEPITGLDPPSIRQLRRSISERAADGTTVLVSSHLLSLVDDLCDFLVLIDAGRVAYCGTMQEALEQEGGCRRSLEEAFFQLTDQAKSQQIGDGSSEGMAS